MGGGLLAAPVAMYVSVEYVLQSEGRCGSGSEAMVNSDEKRYRGGLRCTYNKSSREGGGIIRGGGFGSTPMQDVPTRCPCACYPLGQEGKVLTAGLGVRGGLENWRVWGGGGGAVWRGRVLGF